jgi:hypothetical protein
LRKRPITIAAAGALVLGTLIIAPGEAAISPSTFNAGNGDVTTTTGKDWVNLTNLSGGPIADGGRVYKDDLTSGQGDDSFTQGTAENTEPPVNDTGSIPPNKSDLTRFYLGTEKVSGKQFLYLAWARVLDPNGTTNMDFEFNQGSDGTSANGVTPKRMHGDVLIEYKLSKGGTVPSIFLYRWLTVGGGDITGFPSTCEAGSRPCWSAKKDLTATGFAEGSVNTATITDTLVSPSIDRTPYTFGEASVDLTGAGLFTAGQCTTFGSAYLKSRSSDSFTAALKDYIAPLTINLTNCGSLTVVKQTTPAQSSATTKQSFAFSTSLGNFSLTDASDTPVSTEVKTFTNVQPSSYTITETVPAGWASTGASCDTTPVTSSTTNAITVSVGTGHVTCTFTNVLKPRLTLIKTVTRNSGGSPAVATDWDLSAAKDATTITKKTGDAAVAASFWKVVVDAGTYTLSEGGGPADYTPSDWVCTGATSSSAASVTLANGDDATCTITNDDLASSSSVLTEQSRILRDSATVTMRTGGSASSVKFSVFDSLAACQAYEKDPEDPAGEPLWTTTGTVTEGTGSGTADTYAADPNGGYLALSPGTYYWLAEFSGNTYNDASASGCGDEMTVLNFTDTGELPE